MLEQVLQSLLYYIGIVSIMKTAVSKAFVIEEIAAVSL